MIENQHTEDTSLPGNEFGLDVNPLDGSGTHPC